MGDLDDTAPASKDGSAPPDPRIGTVVGRCTIVRLLGKGGMGAVYEARHTQLSRRFAIKFLLPEFASHQEVLGRFESEAKAAGGLEHPNLIAVTDVGRADDGAPYLVMEYLQGEDCAHLLRRLGPLPSMRAADLVLQACRGLAVAHKAGIVHRDLKPDNLFVTDAGDGSDRVKVLDFGIAQIRSPDRGRVTRTGATLGTPHYMSPEQARGEADLDFRTDVWALGVVLYELLSGRRPFDGDRFLNVVHQILSTQPAPLATLRPGLPPGLVALVERAMTKNTAERLPNVIAFAEALLPFSGRTTLPPAREAGGHEPTMATPATAAGTSGSSAPATHLTAAKSQVSIAAAPKGTSKWRWGVGTAVVAGVVATGILLPRLRDRTASVTGPVAPESAHPAEALSPVPTAAAAMAPAPAEQAARDAGDIPVVHSPSEPSEQLSNKLHKLPQSAPARTPVMTAPTIAADRPRPVPRPSEPSPQPEISANKAIGADFAAASDTPPPAPVHRTKIDRANPY